MFTIAVYLPAAAEVGGDTPPAFLPARAITQADLAALTERVCRRVIRWFRMQRLLDAAAAAAMLAWENSGFSIDASVRGTLIDRGVPTYFRSLEHLLRYCARLPFALEPPPVSPAPGRPTDWGELVQIHDDRDRFQASPDELPVIDIHSL